MSLAVAGKDVVDPPDHTVMQQDSEVGQQHV